MTVVFARYVSKGCRLDGVGYPMNIGKIEKIVKDELKVINLSGNTVTLFANEVVVVPQELWVTNALLYEPPPQTESRLTSRLTRGGMPKC